MRCLQIARTLNVPLTYLERIFPEPSPSLLRSYPVATPYLPAYFSVSWTYLERIYSIPFGLVLPWHPLTFGLLQYSLPLCKIYLDTNFQLSSFKFQLNKIVNCELLKFFNFLKEIVNWLWLVCPNLPRYFSVSWTNLESIPNLPACFHVPWTYPERTFPEPWTNLERTLNVAWT